MCRSYKKSMKNRRIIISIITILGIIAISICSYKIYYILKNLSENNNKFVLTLDDGTRVNNSKNIEQKKLNIEELKGSNIKIEQKDDIVNIYMDVSNTTNSNITDKMIKLLLINNDGKMIKFVDVYIPEIEANNTITISSNIEANPEVDYVDINDVDIRIY